MATEPVISQGIGGGHGLVYALLISQPKLQVPKERKTRPTVKKS